MAKKSINLNSMYIKAMHRPMTKDGYILYPVVDNYKEDENNTDEITVNKSEAYKKQSASYYNSATNIRKLFITGKGIYVQYYAAPVLGERGGPYCEFHDYSLSGAAKEEKDLFSTATAILNYGTELSKYNMSKAAGMKGLKEPARYSVVGNALGVVAHPYVCSNIEEIYFDWTVMMSNDIAPYFREFENNDSYMAFISKSEQGMIKEYPNITEMFMSACSGGSKNIRKRFPRLRMIAMVSKLEDLVHDENGKMYLCKHEDIELRPEAKTWLAENREKIAQSSSVVLYANLEQDLEKPNTTFVVKSSQYKFDAEKLKEKVDAFLEKIEDQKREKFIKKYGNETEDIVNSAEDSGEISELEKEIIRIEGQYGEKALRNIIIYAMKGSGLSASDTSKVFNEQLSAKNKDRIRKLAGFKN